MVLLSSCESPWKSCNSSSQSELSALHRLEVSNSRTPAYSTSSCQKEVEPKTCPGTHRAAGILKQYVGTPVMSQLFRLPSQCTAKCVFASHSLQICVGSNAAQRTLQNILSQVVHKTLLLPERAKFQNLFTRNWNFYSIFPIFMPERIF